MLRRYNREKFHRNVSAWLASIIVPWAFLAWAFPVSAQEDSGEGDPALTRRLLGQQHPVFPRVYDSDPAFVERDAGGFMVWHSFSPGDERVIGRILGKRAAVPFVDLSGGSGTVTPAELAPGAGTGPLPLN